VYKTGKTAGAIAALFDFFAICIKDPVIKEYGLIVRFFHEQQLIAANTEMSIGNVSNLVRI
jgi:hypothetical protein